MHETNISKLNLRVLNFMRDFDGKDITFDDVKKYFSYTELMFVLDRSNLSYDLVKLLEKVEIPSDFQEIIDEHTKEELSEDNEREYMSLTSDEVLLEHIKKLGQYDSSTTLMFLSSDESRLKALTFRSVKKDIDRVSSIVLSFKDENLKMKYLHLFNKDYLPHILSTIKDEKNRRIVIEKYPKYCGSLVAKIEDEAMRIYYYEKYFNKLESYEKTNIFRTLSEENQKRYLERYWKSFSDYEKRQHLDALKSEDLLIEKANLLTSDYEKIQLIYTISGHSEETRKKIESTIEYQNSRRLVKKITRDGLENVYYYINIGKILSSSNERTKVKLLDCIGSEAALQILATMKKFRNVEKYVNHLDDIPAYEEKYDPLIIKYAEHYKLNPEHLVKLVRLAGLEILKNIRMENIQKLVNLDEEDFNKVMELFDVDKHKMDTSTLNDNVNIYLQRAFKLQNPDIINISSTIRLNIQDGKTEEVLKLIDKIVSEFDITGILKKYNYTSEQFIKELLDNSQTNTKVNNCLLEITNGYIVHKRNEFNQKNNVMYQHLFSISRVDPKSVAKFMIENCPFSRIKSSIFDPEIITLKRGYSQAEVELVNNPEILDAILEFRRDPSKGLPNEVKKYMSVFNTLFESEIRKGHAHLPSLPQGTFNSLYSPNITVSQDTIRETLLDLDVDLLKNGILQDGASYQALNEILTKYKLLGFSDVMRDNFSKADLWVDGTTICSLIKYFPVIYEDLKNKMEKSEIKNITLTAMLDMADCYSMESNKLALLFGKDNVRLIASNPGPNSASLSKEKRLEKAQKIIHTMHERKHVSIPPCDRDFELSNGKKMNIVIGNVSDPINLTYGERTGACMRIGGHADDLFNFCLKDDHGFHIRFSSPDDEGFVSRVSGFRNGNTVFLNELRFSEDARYSNEDVREACEMAARFLIEQSKDSPNPIENVVIAPDYVYGDGKTTPLRVSDVKKGIGNFYSDVGANHAVVIATSNPDNSLVPVKLGNGGMKKYPVQRGKIRKYEGEKAIEHLDRIEMIDQILSGKSVDEATLRPKKDIAFCYCGEDWYVTVDSKGNISEYVMEHTNKREIANREKKDCVRQIKSRLGISQEDTLDSTKSQGGTKK